MQQGNSPHEFVPKGYAPLEKSQGLAIASLVVGTISCLTLGLAGVGSLAGIALGVAALYKAWKQPAEFGGRNFAVMGIITSLLSIVITVVIATAFLGSTFRRMFVAQRSRNEIVAVQRVRSIVDAEIIYHDEVSHGSYGTLEDLRDAGMLTHEAVADGYLYEARPGYHDFEVLAAPQVYGSTGRFSFYSTGNGIVRGADHLGHAASAADPVIGIARGANIAR